MAQYLTPHQREEIMRNITVRALWACADLLQVLQGGLIQLASKAVEAGERKAW